MYNIEELNTKLLPELRTIAEQFSISDIAKFTKEKLVYKILDQQSVMPGPEPTDPAPAEEAPKRSRRAKEAQPAVATTKKTAPAAKTAESPDSNRTRQRVRRDAGAADVPAPTPEDNMTVADQESTAETKPGLFPSDVHPLTQPENEAMANPDQESPEATMAVQDSSGSEPGATQTVQSVATETDHPTTTTEIRDRPQRPSPDRRHAERVPRNNDSNARTTNASQQHELRPDSSSVPRDTNGGKARFDANRDTNTSDRGTTTRRDGREQRVRNQRVVTDETTLNYGSQAEEFLTPTVVLNENAANRHYV